MFNGLVSRALLLALSLASWGGLQAQTNPYFQYIPNARHAPFYGYPTMPMVDTPTAEALQDQIRDFAPISTGSLYYTVTAGNPRGSATNAAKDSWVKGILDWMTTGTTTVADQMSALTGYGSAGVNAISEVIQDIQAQLLMPVEAMEGFQKALQAWQLYRRFEVMKKAWNGPMFKIDLLDILPVWNQTDTDNFGNPTTGIRVGITYKNAEGGSDIISRANMDNPFIGDWKAPKFSYQGPHKLADIGLNMSASPYLTSNTDAIIQIGTDANELLDRVWFEGVMGRSVARDGAAYSFIEDTRPSPKLNSERMQRVAEKRAEQITLEIKEIARTFAGQPVRIKEMTDALIDELNYWTSLADGIGQNQAKRIARWRNEIVTANNETVKLESKQHQQNTAMPDAGNGFFDSVFNTYKSVGELVGELINDPNAPDQDGSGDTGPRIIHKANVQYAKARHNSYAEAQAIRKIIHARIKAECQQRMADGFNIMTRQVQRREAEAMGLEAKVAQYQAKTNFLLDRLAKRGLTPAGISDSVYALRRP